MDRSQEESLLISTYTEAVNQFTDQDVHQQNVMDKLPIESTNVTGTYLQHINEDCLLSIFSANSLTLMDLCSIAEICTRFQKICQRAVGTEFSFTSSRKFEVKSTRICKRVKGLDVERVLRNFGSVFSKVKISSTSFSDIDVLSVVTRNCVDNLRMLTLEYLTIPDDDILTLDLKPIFRQLQQLSLYMVYIDGNKMLFTKCNSLVELSVVKVENCRAILENDFPKLQRFVYEAKHGILMADRTFDPNRKQLLETLSTFISRHPSLKKLELCFLDELDVMDLLRVIANSCDNLEEFIATEGSKTLSSTLLQSLRTLNSLKTVQLSKVSFKDLDFFSPLSQLCELCFYDCLLPTDPVQFASLAQLTKLEVDDCQCSDDLDVLGIINCLINLQELAIHGLYTTSTKSHFLLDEKIFWKIVNIVKSRPNVLTLRCEFDFNFKKCHENRVVRLFNMK